MLICESFDSQIVPIELTRKLCQQIANQIVCYMPLIIWRNNIVFKIIPSESSKVARFLFSNLKLIYLISISMGRLKGSIEAALVKRDLEFAMKNEQFDFI